MNLLDNLDVGGPGFNVAHVLSALDQEVTTETPSGAPRVTNDPVRSSGSGGGSGSGTVTDDGDGVVDGVDVGKVSASRITVDSATIIQNKQIFVKRSKYRAAPDILLILDIRIVVDRVDDLDGRGKRSVALQIGHRDGGIGVRHSPGERGNLGANSGAAVFASGSCL